MVSSKEQELITEILRRELGQNLCAIYLFGSLVGDQSLASSDLDLAVLMQNMPEASDAYNAKTALSYQFKRDVDLVDLWRADTITKAQVVSSGELIYARDAADVAAFETVVLSQYALLNEERAGILADIASKGTIHGR